MENIDVLDRIKTWPLPKSSPVDIKIENINWEWLWQFNNWVICNKSTIYDEKGWRDYIKDNEDEKRSLMSKPTPHIFDLISYWPEVGAPHPGTKNLPEGWMWQWIGDDWVLSNGTIGLVRDDWFKYNDKQVADQPVELGTKADSGKPMMGCIPPHAELAVARVLTFGAKKYSRGNWAHVDNSDERYMDAALRHINAHRRGENTDSETGESHLSHAICCLMFMLDGSETH